MLWLFIILTGQRGCFSRLLYVSFSRRATAIFLKWSKSLGLWFLAYTLIFALHFLCRDHSLWHCWACICSNKTPRTIRRIILASPFFRNVIHPVSSEISISYLRLIHNLTFLHPLNVSKFIIYRLPIINTPRQQH